MINIYDTINKAIKLARKAGEKTAVAIIYQEHDVMKVIEELAKCGWYAKATRCGYNSRPDLTIIEYEIEL